MKNFLVLFLAALSFIACENANTDTTNEAAAEKVEEVAPKKVKETLTKGGLQVGDTAPDFELKNVDGNTYSLSSIKLEDGSEPKGFIVTFTCNTCPYAVAYEDRLIELHNDMVKKGYPIVAINPNDPSMKAGDSFEKMQERATQKEFPFLYLFDEKQEVFPVYGATRTPEMYVLDKDLVVRYTGAIDDNYQDAAAVEVKYVRSAIDAIDGGKEPDPAFTKAIGCSIKVKKS